MLHGIIKDQLPILKIANAMLLKFDYQCHNELDFKPRH